MISVKSEPLLPYSFAGAMGIHWFLLVFTKGRAGGDAPMQGTEDFAILY